MSASAERTDCPSRTFPRWTTTRRGTVLQFLRELGAASDRHAYVLPGDERGASVGCFLADPAGAAGLPPLRMIGDGRNLADASITEDPDGAEITQARVLRVDDQGVTTFETSAADLGLMRALPAVPADLTPRRLLHPADNTREDPEGAAAAQARRSGYVYRLAGRVIPGCYAAVLQPYLKVRLDAGATPYSGEYLITRVVHRITPSLYSQQIEAKADSLTEVSGEVGATGGVNAIERATTSFLNQFDTAGDPAQVTLDCQHLSFVDYSAVAALKTLRERYAKAGKHLRVVHLSERCKKLLKRAGEQH